MTPRIPPAQIRWAGLPANTPRVGDPSPSTGTPAKTPQALGMSGPPSRPIWLANLVPTAGPVPSVGTTFFEPLELPPLSGLVPAALDRHNLNRFVDSQNQVYRQVIAELQAGQKQTHWGWYIFPQVRGLGSSSNSQDFAIGSMDEAVAYLDHPVLGPRLRECVELMNLHPGRTPVAILGRIDAAKFRSCLTLFSRARPEEPLFMDALKRHFDGDFDPLTVAFLESK